MALHTCAQHSIKKEMMKSKNVSCTDRLQFVLLSLASLLIIDLALETLIDVAFGMQASGYPHKEQLTHVTIALAYAAIQRYLLARYLRLELRHWLYWTTAGLLIGSLCLALMQMTVPAPSELWWRQRISLPPAPIHQFTATFYHATRDFLRFGLVAFFQVLALPRHTQPLGGSDKVPESRSHKKQALSSHEQRGLLKNGRKAWLLAATIAAPLWHDGMMLPALILALALVFVATLARRAF